MAFESIENAHFRAKNANRVIASAHICIQMCPTSFKLAAYSLEFFTKKSCLFFNTLNQKACLSRNLHKAWEQKNYYRTFYQSFKFCIRTRLSGKVLELEWNKTSIMVQISDQRHLTLVSKSYFNAYLTVHPHILACTINLPFFTRVCTDSLFIRNSIKFECVPFLNFFQIFDAFCFLLFPMRWFFLNFSKNLISSYFPYTLTLLS